MLGAGRGWGRAGVGLNLPPVNAVLQQNLQQLSASLEPGGLPLPAFQELWHSRFGTVLHAAQYGELNVPDLITRHSQGQLLVINKRPPGLLPQPYVIPKPTKEQLENAVRRAQEQLHSQGMSVTVGSLDCALARAFGLTGSLAELGWQPRDLAPVQDLMLCERNVSILISTFLRARPVCTLADLDAYLALQHKVTSYNDLRMGPLLCHELVVANFRPPEDLVEIPQVTIAEVVDTIADLMEENRPRQPGMHGAAARAAAQGDGTRMNWGDVRQRLETRFGVPFEYLCVRLPQGTGMGIFITNMVSGWKSEREQVQAGIKRLSMQYQKVASKCGDELREVARALVLQHARTLNAAVVDRTAAIQAVANRAVEVFFKDESTVIHTQLVLQPLSLQQLQSALLQLLTCAVSTSSSQPTSISFLSRKARVRKAGQQQEGEDDEATELSRCAMFKAAADPLELLTLPDMGFTRVTETDELLAGSRLQSVKELCAGNVSAAVRVVDTLITPSLSRRLMQSPPADAAAAADGVDGGAGPMSPPPPPPPPPRAAAAAGGAGAGDGAAAGSAAAAVNQAVAESGDVGADEDGSAAAADLGAGTGSGVFVFSSLPQTPAATKPAKKPAMGLQLSSATPGGTTTSSSSTEPKLSPAQLSELLWGLLDTVHDVLWRQQRQHKLLHQQLQDQQQHAELLQQTGMDPEAALEESQTVAMQRAEQQERDLAREAVESARSAAEKRWWRKQGAMPPDVFGSSSEEASLQLEVVAAAGGELVEKIAGPLLGDKRLKDALTNYYRHDALLQLLLHAVRVLVEYGALLQPSQQQQDDSKREQSSEEEVDDSAAAREQEAAVATRSVGLQELLSAMQELGRGASLHALWQLEVALLKRFEVPSFHSLQVPGGCSTLLSALGTHDDLAAALTGYADSWDCGAVPLQEVLRVVQQTLRNLKHRRGRTDSEGALANAVAAVLCTHFGVPDVQRLGYGSVQCLLREAAEEEDSGGSGVAAASSTGSPSAAAAGGAGDSRAADSGPACWTALALTSQTGASSFTAHASGLTAAHGLATLSAAPVLSDLGIWCDWATLYAPVLGPLPAFLSKHQQQLGFRVLEVPGGGLLKLPDVGAGSGSEQLDLQQLRSGMKQAVEQDKPEQLIGLLLLHVAQQGGLAAAHDLFMLGDLLASLLAADVARHQGGGGGTSSSSSRAWMQAAGAGADQASFLTPQAAMKQLQGLSAVQQRVLLFILQCLQLLPVPVASTVAGEVLLRPLGHVLGWEAEVVQWGLLVAAVAAEGAHAVQLPGLRSGTTAAATAALLKTVSAKGRLVSARQRLHALGFSSHMGIACWQDDCMSSVAAHAAGQHLQRQQQAAASSDAAAGTSTSMGVQIQPPAAAAVDDISKPDSLPQQQPTAVVVSAAAADAAAATATQPDSSKETAAAPADDDSMLAAAAAPDAAGAQAVGAADAAQPQAGSAEVSTAQQQQQKPDSSNTQQVPVVSVPSASAAVQQPVSTDLSLISNPYERYIEERRLLRGVGMNLQGEAAAFAQAQIKTIGNAVRKLSQELYSRQIHFVLELVQNADDNRYDSQAAGLPVLELVTSSRAVTCLNNEVGFTQRDVEGICEVGGSKKFGVAGFTGAKGIGFKAVFRVTNCPQIHSGGFNFAFDLQQHPELGYVLPTWIGRDPLHPALVDSLQSSILTRLLQQQHNQAGRVSSTAASTAPASASAAASLAAGPALSRLLGPSNMTLLHLPLKPGSEDVGQKLAQLRPTLLLFLRQLRCLVLSDADAGTSKVMLRVEEPESDFVRLLVRTVALPLSATTGTTAVTAVAAAEPDSTPSTPDGDSVSSTAAAEGVEGADGGSDSDSTDQQAWQSAAPALSPAAVESLLSSKAGCEVLLQEESRWLVVSETFSPGDICRLGYEVELTTVALAFGVHEPQPTQKEVFAFLPVRRCGLNFVLQGDFVVPSSRGDIDCDDPFNQLLHSKVAGLFAASFAKFKAMPPPKGESQLFWIDWWCRCVPLPDQLHEFFTSLPEEVASHLQALPCIPCVASDTDPSAVVWVPPGKALVSSSPQIKELVSAEQLARLQDKFFVHPAMTVLYEPRSPLRKLLGIREFDPNELISLVRDMAAAGELSGHSIPQLRQLLVTVFGLLFGGGMASSATPSSGSATHSNNNSDGSNSTAAAAGSGSIAVSTLLKKLRECPLLPLYGSKGTLVPAKADGSSSAAVFFPVEGLAATQPAAVGKTSRGSRSSQRPGAADSLQPSQLAANALRSCSITQQQLAGLDGAAGAAGGAAVGTLLFVDPELLQLEDSQQRSIMVQGLKGLGLREVEPLDVVHGFILPQLGLTAERLQLEQQQQQPDASTAPPRADSSETADAGPAVAPSQRPQLDKQQQLHLMRLLAFPLAARLLDAELGAAGPGVPHTQQQEQQQGYKSWDSYQAGSSSSSSSGGGGAIPASRAQPAVGGAAGGKAGSLLSQLARMAVLVTSTGQAVLAPSCATQAAAAESTTDLLSLEDDGLFLPKQLGNGLDLPQLFPAHSWQLVSPDYASCCSGINPQQWSLLMQPLGVQTFLPVRQQTVELTWKQLMVGQEHAAWRGAVERMDDSVRYVFSDWQWSSLQRLLASIAGDTDAVRRTQQYRSLASVVAGLWSQLQASGQLSCSHSLRTVAAAGGSAKGSQAAADAGGAAADPQQQRHRKKAAADADSGGASKPVLSAGAASWQPGRQGLKLPSSVLLGLQTWPWMLASDGKAHPPTELFARQQDTRQLFRDKVLHIVADDVGLGLARELGATCDTSTETVLQVLTAWSDQQTAAAAASDAKATAAADTSAAASTPPAAAALAGEQAAATTGGFTATLSDMAQLYHHLFKQLTPSAGAHSSSASAPAELPRRGFSALQDPGVKLSPEIKSRMRVSKAFSEVPLIWLPDTDEVLRAAAAVSRAAESEQRSYMDEEAAHSMMSSAGRGGAGGFGGRGGGAAGGFAGGRTGANRRGGGRQGAGVSAKQQQQQQAASDDPVADDVMYDAALISSVAHTPMRGRFYGIEQLRFTDDARVFEVTYPVLHKHYGGISNSSTSGSAAQPPPMLRVLGRYYGSLQELFVDVLQRFKYDKWIPLVGKYPTFGDYSRTLQAVITATGDKAAPESFSYRMVYRVLSTWAADISRHRISAIAQQNLYSVLTGGRNEQPFRVLPGRDGSWLTLYDHPHVADDAELLQLFQDVQGISFLADSNAAAATHHETQQTRPSSGLRPQSGTTAASAATADLASLWYALAIPHLGQIVEPGPAFVQPPEPQPARQLSVCLAAALPLLQRHLCSILAAAEYQVVDDALRPRLLSLRVLAVTELARVHQLRVVNSQMSADALVVKRDGASWVQRKQACVALLDLARDDEQQQQQQQEQEQQHRESEGVSQQLHGEADGAQQQHEGSNADATPSKAAAPAAAADAQDDTPQQEQEQGEQQQRRPADALYVVSPDNLIECCHQVSAEVAAYIGLLSEEAGCDPLDVGALTALLEKLLMVQATGGDVSQVLKAPPYNRYPELPDTATAWQLVVPPEPEPEPQPDDEGSGKPSEPSSPTGSHSSSGSSDGDGGDGSPQEEGSAAAVKPQLPGLGATLDLSDLLSGEAETSSALDAVHQWRLEHEAEVKAKIEAAAAARAAQAAADAGGASGAAAAAGVAASAGSGGAAAPAARQPHNPLVISGDIGPAIIPSVRRAADAAAAATTAAAVQQHTADGSTAVAAAADYHQEVIVVQAQASPQAAPTPMLPASFMSPDKIVVVASQQGTPAAAAAAAGAISAAAAASQLLAAAEAAAAGDVQQLVGSSPMVDRSQIDNAAGGSSTARRHLDMNAAAGGAGDLGSAIATEQSGSGAMVQADGAGGGTDALVAALPDVLFDDAPTAATTATSTGVQDISRALPPGLHAAAVRVPQLIFLGVPTFSLLGPVAPLQLQAQHAASETGFMVQVPPAVGLPAAGMEHTGGAGAGFVGMQEQAAGPLGGGVAAAALHTHSKQPTPPPLAAAAGEGVVSPTAVARPQAGWHPSFGPPAAFRTPVAQQEQQQQMQQGTVATSSHSSWPGEAAVAGGMPPEAAAFNHQHHQHQQHQPGDMMARVPAGLTPEHFVGAAHQHHPLPVPDGGVSAAAAVHSSSSFIQQGPGDWGAQQQQQLQQHLPPPAGFGSGFGGGGGAGFDAQHSSAGPQHHAGSFAGPHQHPHQNGMFGGGGFSAPPGLSSFGGPFSPARGPHPSHISGSGYDAEGAARAAGFISEEVPLPLQVLSGLQSALPPAPQHDTADGAADTAVVGRFGEELAYNYYLQHPEMQQLQQQHGGAVVVEWVNQSQESWLPFDLVVRDAASGGVLCFVEVKASRHAAKEFFELSEKEFACAAREGDRYHVLRIRGVGSGAPTLERLINPVRLWQERAVRVCIVL